MRIIELLNRNKVNVTKFGGRKGNLFVKTHNFRDEGKLWHSQILFQTRFEFPTDIDESEDCSDLAKDLMKRLICSPNVRFGKGGVDDFKQHAWFNGIDWENIRDSECPFSGLSVIFQVPLQINSLDVWKWN